MAGQIAHGFDGTDLERVETSHPDVTGRGHGPDRLWSRRGFQRFLRDGRFEQKRRLQDMGHAET